MTRIDPRRGGSIVKACLSLIATVSLAGCDLSAPPTPVVPASPKFGPGAETSIAPRPEVEKPQPAPKYGSTETLADRARRERQRTIELRQKNRRRNPEVVQANRQALQVIDAQISAGIRAAEQAASFQAGAASSGGVSVGGSPRTQHVGGYTRSNGTYVAPYMRSPGP
jgi:hypothetical protein